MKKGLEWPLTAASGRGQRVLNADVIVRLYRILTTRGSLAKSYLLMNQAFQPQFLRQRTLHPPEPVASAARNDWAQNSLV
jgi:hypothetical protein